MARIGFYRLVFIALLVAASFAAPLCLADTKASGPVTIIDFPSGQTFPWGINDKGEVVGQVTWPLDWGSNAYLYSGGKSTQIKGPAGATFVAAFGINNKGDIVGTYKDEKGQLGGFLLRNGVYTILPTPPLAKHGFCATGINDRGDIIGSYINEYNKEDVYTSKRRAYGFLLKDGVYTLLGSPGLLASQNIANWPGGINDNGEIVGTCEDSSARYHGYVLKDGKYRIVDAKKGAYVQTILLGINNEGQILGCWKNGFPPWPDSFAGVPFVTDHRFLLHDDVFTPISSPPGTERSSYTETSSSGVGPPETKTILDGEEADALGFNDRGQIVGNFVSKKDSLSHGYRMDTK